MNKLKHIITCLLLLGMIKSFGQRSYQTQRDSTKVKLFSDEENANLQIYFYNKTKEMKLSDEVENEYDVMLLFYIYKMQRLNDKDKYLTIDEQKIELEKIILKMNSKIKDILPPDKYKLHLKNFSELIDIVQRKMDLTKKKE